MSTPCATPGSPPSTLSTGRGLAIGVGPATPGSGLDQAVAEGVPQSCPWRQHDDQRVEPVAVGVAQIGVQLARGDDEVVGAVEHADPLPDRAPSMLLARRLLPIVDEHHLAL